ncbi:MAG: hypothetical protein P4L69_16975 [Desulfosporosinus sp.]|nr:hypothetical protein [Desulfosporosinus sp.]
MLTKYHLRKLISSLALVTLIAISLLANVQQAIAETPQLLRDWLGFPVLSPPLKSPKKVGRMEQVQSYLPVMMTFQTLYLDQLWQLKPGGL